MTDTHVNQQTRLEKTLYYIAQSSIIGATALIMYVAYLLLFPVRTIVLNSPITILTQQVERGGVVVFEMDYCKYVDSPSSMRVGFVNGVIVESVVSIQHLPKGCHKKTLEATMPFSAPPHTYRLAVKKTIQVNQLRSVTRVFESENTVRVLDSLDLSTGETATPSAGTGD